ncbi:MAG: hypothetical protein PHO01_02850 [Desulfotomaculaceae bacterium]|nr:hypothetical protein [Desulfotomaculaceae bacterium]
MAIYGIGAMYEGKYDMTQIFIDNKCACIGWEPDDAPVLYSILRKVKIGDFIYIKSIVIASKEIRIKAIGVIVDYNIREYKSCHGHGVGVKWLWTGDERIHITEKMYRNNVFNNTLYEEYNHDIQVRVLDLSLKPKK